MGSEAPKKKNSIAEIMKPWAIDGMKPTKVIETRDAVESTTIGSALERAQKRAKENQQNPVRPAPTRPLSRSRRLARKKSDVSRLRQDEHMPQQRITGDNLKKMIVKMRELYGEEVDMPIDKFLKVHPELVEDLVFPMVIKGVGEVTSEEGLNNVYSAFHVEAEVVRASRDFVGDIERTSPMAKPNA